MFLPLFPILVFLCFFSMFCDKKSKHMKKIKVHGPPSYPIIGCLFSFYKNRHCLLDWYTQLLASSPTKTIVVHRLGAPRTVVTANVKNVEYMLKNNFLNYPKGEPMNEILGDFLGRGIFNVDGDLWSAQRKLASYEFTARSLRELVVTTLEEEVERRLSPLLEAASRTAAVLDLQEVLRRFAFDTICKISLGSDPGCLYSDSNSVLESAESLVYAFDKASEISARRGMAPVFAVWKCKRTLNVGSEKKLKEHIKVVHEHVEEIIRARKQQKTDKSDVGSDFLSRLLKAGHKDDVVRDMVISFLVAGRDTTSSAMTWLFWLLAKHRHVEKNVIDEVLSVMNKGDRRSLDFDHLKEMNYIKASLCESMRLYPPVAWDSKHAATDDVLPDGTPVYKGNRVTFSPYAIGRMENLWGEDWLEFKPDRWFDEHGALKQVSPFKFPVFQAGPRVCLGKEMAFIQMKYAVASILRRFRIRPVCTELPIFVPLLTGYMARGLFVRVYLRES